MVCRNGKVHYSAVSFFLLTIPKSDYLAEIKWSVCISKSKRTLCFTFSWTDYGLHIYNLFIWSNFSFLHNSQWVSFSIQSCLALNSFFCIKRKKNKKRQIPKTFLRIKTLGSKKVTVIAIVIGAHRTLTKMIRKETVRLWNKRTRRVHPDYGIINIS